MAKYLYPAIFEKEDGMYNVVFPDLEGCYTCGASIEDAYEMAQDALCMMMYELEQQGVSIPKPKDVKKIHCGDNSFATLVVCDTKEYRRVPTIQEILECVQSIAKRFSIKTAVLIGPFANGTATIESCVELLVEFVEPIVSLYRIIGLKYYMEDYLKVNVEIIHASLEEYSDYISGQYVGIY